MSSVETRLDGSTLVGRIPMRFQRRSGRKRIVAPDGSEVAPSQTPRPDGTLVKALARAWRWQKLLDDDFYTGIAELADAERISRSYVCRVLRVTLLAPDIVERILDGRPTAGLAQFLKPFPVEWEQQREHFLCSGLAYLLTAPDGKPVAGKVAGSSRCQPRRAPRLLQKR